MSPVFVGLYVLCETDGGPQCQPVYYLLISLGCYVLIFLCGMQA